MRPLTLPPERHIHTERQPHKWAIAWTTFQVFDYSLCQGSIDAGGHFFISSYEIHIQAAANTLIAWRPSDWHGTSLYLMDSKNPSKEYHQCGLALITGPCIVSVAKKLMMGEIGEKEAEELALIHEPDKFDKLCAQIIGLG